MRRLILFSVLGLGACSDDAPKKPPFDLDKARQEAAAAAVGKDWPASIEAPDLTVSTAPADIEKGKALFATKGCQACHRTDDQKLVGPGLKGVTARRSTKWIERMMLKPEVMVQQDPVAKELLAKHMVPMANQHVDPAAELPALLAYLKSLE